MCVRVGWRVGDSLNHLKVAIVSSLSSNNDMHI